MHLQEVSLGGLAVLFTICPNEFPAQKLPNLKSLRYRSDLVALISRSKLAASSAAPPRFISTSQGMLRAVHVFLLLIIENQHKLSEELMF